IANDWSYEIIRPKRIGGTNGGCFLTERSIDAADHFRLTIKIDDAFFDQPREFQIAIQLKHLLGLEQGIGDTRTRLTIRGLARRILGADAHLKAGAATMRSAMSIFGFRFCHCDLSSEN